MNGTAKIALVLISLHFWGGCERDNRTGHPPEIVVGRIEAIRAALTQRGSRFKHLVEFEATDRLFDEISDGEARKAAAEAFGRMILSVDLQSLPLPFRETATSKYVMYVCQGFKIMRRCGLSARDAMEFFFQGLAKYRDSCESPSLAMPIQEGESPDAARDRWASARILKEDYAARMSILEQVWLPNLSRYLPSELHDEFRRRLKAFRTLPTPDESSLEGRRSWVVRCEQRTKCGETCRNTKCQTR